MVDTRGQVDGPSLSSSREQAGESCSGPSTTVNREPFLATGVPSTVSRVDENPMDAPNPLSQAGNPCEAKGRNGVQGGARLLRAYEVAAYLAISERKLWELTNRGDIPCVRMGRTVRYDPPDVRAWVRARKQRAGKSVGSRQGSN